MIFIKNLKLNLKKFKDSLISFIRVKNDSSKESNTNKTYFKELS
ncbi:hypothetical protein RIEPE_0511 [Candidatus Riesia pediculicola USDA]|uniref:Uncharacterized protein n=1 Tax=Riesia pediculicola (strain USDA) TaxID=515618 RepID=D4G8T9_RIEPU|nr:hypothetical protein RIEPE_0511 [Candidatus Riesia pediculicola USDA]